MAFCGKCGTQVNEGIKFYANCGEAIGAPAPEQTQAHQAAEAVNAPEQNNIAASFDAADIEANKFMAVLAYILFLIPLLAAKESPYAKFHTNQGLTLFLAGVVVSVLGSIIPFLGWFLILPVGCTIVGILGIIGIINAFGGKAKELPIIGKIKILK